MIKNIDNHKIIYAINDIDSWNIDAIDSIIKNNSAVFSGYYEDMVDHDGFQEKLTFLYSKAQNILVVTDIYEFNKIMQYENILLISGHEQCYLYDMNKQKLVVWFTR